MRITVPFALLLLACGGSVAPSTSQPDAADVVAPDASQAQEAGPDAVADGGPADASADAGSDACPSLEGDFCASGNDTCGPCPAKGWVYRCVVENGNTSLHLTACDAGAPDCPCGVN